MAPKRKRDEMTGPPRKSYTAEHKLEVVAYAKEHGNRAAGRQYGVGETSVREWKKAEEELKMLQPRKRARRGQSAKWPILEDNLASWVHAQRDAGRAVSTVNIRMKAKTMAVEMGIMNFLGNPSWIYKFMKRKQLSVRVRTTVGQRLPDDWEEKMSSFRDFVANEITARNLSPDDVINMDEVPMSFDIPPTRSVAPVGTKTIGISTTGHERNNFTVVLACTASGVKLKPMVIFKRVTMPRVKFPAGVVVVVNKKGWMNTEVMKTWVSKCYRTRRGSFFKKNSLLVMDAMTAHLDEDVKKTVNAAGGHVAIIPGGLTSKLQPLDIAVNRPFKAIVREEWAKWMLEGKHTFTPAGRQRRADYDEVCKWILSSWQRVKLSTIVNGFAKSGIVNEQTVDTSDTDSDDSCSSDNGDGASEEQMLEVLELLRESDTETDTSFNGFEDDDDDEDDDEH